jgi:serine/threonine protein kinase
MFKLLDKLGTGDISDVYRAQVQDQVCVLKIARNGRSKRLLAKEREILEQLLERDSADRYCHYVPRPLPGLGWSLGCATAFQWRQGLVAADQALRQEPSTLEFHDLARIFDRLLQTLGYVHRAGWIHGAVLPPHLLLDPANQSLQLIGWIHAEQRGTPLRVVAARYKADYPPECIQRRGASPTTDIFLAAKSIVMLAGGHRPFDTIPSHLPSQFRQFLTACMLESPRMRPQDAWQLQHELADLLGFP